MRLMSFSMTEDALVAGAKTVTRRLGWRNLKVGEVICAVNKSMGLRKGEHPRTLGFIRVASIGREPIESITKADVEREGFPTMTPSEFVERFCAAMKCSPSDEVTRIEFVFASKLDAVRS